MDDLSKKLAGTSDSTEVRFGSIQIGRFKFHDTVVSSSAAVPDLIKVLTEASRLGRRIRTTENATRYERPLELGAAARRLSAEIKDFNEMRKCFGLRDRSVEKCARSLTMLQAVCGDIYVSDIKLEHIYKFFDLVRWTGDRMASVKNLERYTVDELIARGRAKNMPRPTKGTFESHRRSLSTFFNRLLKSGAIGVSPMAGFTEIKGDDVQDPGRERLFNNADLQRIFNQETFEPWARKWPHRWWAPMLGLHLGARVNEICQLKLIDIQQHEGHWCISIRATIDDSMRGTTGPRTRQSVKGTSSVRLLPIPPPILEAGFMDFVDDVRRHGHHRLFPNLSSGKISDTGQPTGSYADMMCNQFGTYMSRLGFPKGVRFHAFRHTLITTLARNYSLQQIATVTGHSVKLVGEINGYNHATSAKVVEHVVPTMELKQELLSAFCPPLILPTYVKGQFDGPLKKWPGARHYD